MHAGSELSLVLTKISNRLQLGQRARNPGLFREAVETWCVELGWPHEAARLGLDLERVHSAHLGRLAFAFDAAVKEKKEQGSLQEQGGQALRKVAKRIPVFGSSLEVHAHDYIGARDEAMVEMKAEDYLLIALTVAAAGYAIHRFARRPPESPSAPPVLPVGEPSQRVLVLVINASRDGVIHALRSGGLAALEGDLLYQATQALWLGSEAEYRNSNMSDWFSNDRAVSEPSEYDVHLVRVELPSDDPGLHRNANQMDRLDAFRRFQSASLKATVSPRLPSEAYGTTEVYSR
ncbi:MAG: hypothetical protein U0230_17770 [Polyangiales bacterium]